MKPVGPKIAFIGFGEAAQAFVTGFARDGHLTGAGAFDVKTDGPQRAEKQADYTRHAVTGAETPADITSGAQAIFSLVTADQAEAAATRVAATTLDGTLFLDCNSCAPNTKRRNAQRIETAGGRYVDVAVMTPVHPKLHQAPCLVAGPHATAAQETMQRLGMSVDVAGPEVGDASTRKMVRSIMIKGLEALTLECFLTARQAGIEDDILASLEASFPGFGWAERAPYMMERAATHGIRRAEEMQEVAQTIRDLGLDPFTTTGTVQRQRQVGALGLNLAERPAQDLATRSDAILNALAAKSDCNTKPET